MLVRKLPVFYIWVQDPETKITMEFERFYCRLEEIKISSLFKPVKGLGNNGANVWGQDRLSVQRLVAGW
jgi:hypothetical protein